MRKKSLGIFNHILATSYYIPVESRLNWFEQHFMFNTVCVHMSSRCLTIPCLLFSQTNDRESEISLCLFLSPHSRFNFKLEIGKSKMIICEEKVTINRFRSILCINICTIATHRRLLLQHSYNNGRLRKNI